MREEEVREKYYIKPREPIVRAPVMSGVSADKKKSLLLQFYWLSNRYLKIKISDKQNLWLLVAQPFIIAGLISVIFHSIGVPVMMLIAISAIWFGVSNSSKEIVSEFSIYKRERMFNLNINTYILSKWTILSLIAFLQVVIFLGIVYLKFGRGNDSILGDYGQNVAFMFFIASSATLFGLFLSAYFTSTEKVLTVVPIALMPQIMLAGVVERLTSLKVDILSYFTLGRWGTEGLARLQKGPFLPKQSIDDFFYNGDLEKGGSGIVNAFNTIQANILVILLISIIMYILTYYSLKKKDTI